ncbi:MAG: PAS domain S-box protein [Deltaproteobacteria bacterium]|nr:PAS domain S-box protein [Deltaproteobacteria bacterium]
MEALDAREFIKSLTKLIGRVNLYGLGHPAATEAFNALDEPLSSILKSGPVTISAAEGKVLVNGLPVEETSSLSSVLGRFDIHSLVFEPGVARKDMALLAKALSTGSSNAFEDPLFSTVSCIRVNTVHYVKTGSDTAPELGVDFDAEAIGGLTIEAIIRKFIEKTVPSSQDRKKIFEIVMNKFSSEVADKVNDATRELKKEKAEIERDKEKTESVIANSVLGSITVDRYGKIVMLNPEGEKIVGSRLMEKAGRPVWEGLGEGQMVTIIGNEDGSAISVKDVMVKGEDETKRLLRASNAVIRDLEGKMVGIFSVLSDITKYKELDRMKKDFVASVTHELRTPLAATKQALSNILVLNDSLEGEQKKMLEIALRNTERLSRLVNDILDFAKIEAGKLKLKQEIIETGVLLKEVISTVRPLAESKGVQLSFESSGALPRLLADRDRITQVFINLLSNAVKFTDKDGKVAVYASGLNTDGNNAFLNLSVKDTGRGMEKEDLGKIFNKFVQVGPASSGGTGLGLAITKAIVEAHGGAVKAESEICKGSVFTVALPVLPEDASFARSPAQKKFVNLN